MIALILKRFAGYKNSLLFLIVVVFYSTATESLIAQQEDFEDIITSFEDYGSLYREVVYCHLNKSTFIKGEMIGFSGYAFDKNLKTPSKLTKNLYCVITDSNDKVIKSKLLKVTNGFTNNVFKIDSAFTSGNYTFKAYTNWMNNFEEPNAFIESFRVINPEVETTIKKRITENNLDVQFLPEGGYLVDAVKTNVGVIIKNTEGFGVSDIEGKVYDSNDKFIVAFKTNSLGIGKFQLHPDINQEYIVKINHLNKAFEFNVDNIKPKGISINLNNSEKNLEIVFKTNEETLKDINEKSFKLVIHNGAEIKGSIINFKEKDIVKRIEHEKLFTGINIFTLFDENNKPILERLFFNYKGINLINSGNPNYTKLKDSITVSLPFKALIDSSIKNSNISISVLPEETGSYQRHHNIISHTYLQPYLKGYIENAQYYFTNINSKKKNDLDNLLITQGWSSYNWEDIFANNVTNSFVFENGFVLKANSNNRQKDFLLYPLKSNEGMVLNLEDDESSFVVSKLYPEGKEKLGIGILNKKGKVKNPNLDMQVFPSKIPDYNNHTEVLYANQSTIVKAISPSPFTFIDLDETQLLDEVLVEANAKEIKIEKLKNHPYFKIDVFDDVKRGRNYSFVNYINAFIPTYLATEYSGDVIIQKRVPSSLLGELNEDGVIKQQSPEIPIIYLNDQRIPDLDFFYGWDMSIVDYISVNRNGFGEGFLGAHGVIRIYTSLDFIKKRKNSPFKQYAFPLTFSEDKKFYTPKYNVYSNDFYKEYGVIDWIPNSKVDDSGNINFTVYNPANNNIKLFIEGVTDNGDFVSEIKILNINNNN